MRTIFKSMLFLLPVLVLNSAEAAVQKQGDPPTDYLVKDGDTLFDIAQAYYGDGNLYTKIQEANQGLTPQTLLAGHTIHIPAIK